MCMDSLFMPAFACVLSRLMPLDFQQLTLVSVQVHACTVALRQNERYWKQRFENSIRYVFPVDQDPGTTSWLRKYRRIIKTLSACCHPLYFSTEIFDVKLAYELGGCPMHFVDRHEVIRFALHKGNETVIRFLASIPAFKMAKCLRTSDLMTNLSRMPIETLAILLDPALELGLSILTLLPEVDEGDRKMCKFLLDHPSAKVTEHIVDYLRLTMNEHRPVMLELLLDKDGVEIPENDTKKWHRSIISFRDRSGISRMVSLLETHPKTARYFA